MQPTRPCSAGTLPAVARACPELAEGAPRPRIWQPTFWREACHENVNPVGEKYMSLWGS
jgi:hypothetical protein